MLDRRSKAGHVGRVLVGPVAKPLRELRRGSGRRCRDDIAETVKDIAHPNHPRGGPQDKQREAATDGGAGQEGDQVWTHGPPSPVRGAERIIRASGLTRVCAFAHTNSNRNTARMTARMTSPNGVR